MNVRVRSEQTRYYMNSLNCRSDIIEDEALSKFGFTLCHKILIAANIIALIWVNFHKFGFLQTSGTTRDDVVILEAPTTTTTTAAIIPSTTSSTVNSMSSMIAESVPVSETGKCVEFTQFLKINYPLQPFQQKT